MIFEIFSHPKNTNPNLHSHKTRQYNLNPMWIKYPLITLNEWVPRRSYDRVNNPANGIIEGRRVCRDQSLQKLRKLQ